MKGACDHWRNNPTNAGRGVNDGYRGRQEEITGLKADTGKRNKEFRYHQTKRILRVGIQDDRGLSLTAEGNDHQNNRGLYRAQERRRAECWANSAPAQCMEAILTQSVGKNLVGFGVYREVGYRNS